MNLHEKFTSQCSVLEITLQNLPRREKLTRQILGRIFGVDEDEYFQDSELRIIDNDIRVIFSFTAKHPIADNEKRMVYDLFQSASFIPSGGVYPHEQISIEISDLL